MLDYSGIFYRIWAVGGVIILLGLACLLLSGFRTKSFSKQCFYAGLLCVIYGLGTAGYYFKYLFSPEIDTFQGVLYEEYRNSRVAPPLPFTMEYSFSDMGGEKQVFYLDLLSEKEIIPDGLSMGTEYVIYYEVNTNIILRVEEVM